ncbi:MAG: GNAT family N-acetyltransferase [Firmicutes bacterium]|nr:GNAT family N-acetyltransferase [Bacillota bacterium]
METARLVIRKFIPDDWRDLFAYLSQEAVVLYEPYGIFTEEESKNEAVRRSQDDRFWAVCLQSTGTLIGNLYLAKQDFDTWAMGYAFNANFQGKGYATEAARALLEDVFKNQNAHRVAAMCNPMNESSWKLLERLNFRREGHLVKNVYFKEDITGNPIWVDTFQYGILAEEWCGFA